MGLELDNLPNAARRVWTAIMPPVTHLVGTAAAIVFVFGFDTVADLALSTNWRLVPSDEAKEVLEFYGFAGIAPVFLGLLVLIVAHGVQHGLTWLGARVPPHLTSNTTIQMQAAADAWTLRRLWSLHPDFDPVQGLNMLNVATDEAVAQAEIDSKAHHRLRQVVVMRDRSTNHRAHIRFTKGLAAVVVIAGLAAPLLGAGIASVARLVLMVTFLTAWQFYLAVALLESEHAYYRAKIETYLEVNEALLGKPLQPHIDNTSRDHQRIFELQAWLRGMPAWELTWKLSDDTVRARKQLLAAIARFLHKNLRGEGRT